MTFLPSIVAPVVDDHESSTELALPGPIEGSLIPVSSHCLDCRRAFTCGESGWHARLSPAQGKGREGKRREGPQRGKEEQEEGRTDQFNSVFSMFGPFLLFLLSSLFVPIQ